MKKSSKLLIQTICSPYYSKNINPIKILQNFTTSWKESLALLKFTYTTCIITTNIDLVWRDFTTKEIKFTHYPNLEIFLISWEMIS